MARRRRQEKFHEKHSWVLLFALSLPKGHSEERSDEESQTPHDPPV